MRRMIAFDCGGHQLAATLDEGTQPTGLLIVSGGNEIRSGAHSGQAAMAAHFAGLGYPVFRYDRRGIGDSEGDNGGFENSASDIAAAVAAFRAEVPGLSHLVAFGNCDAASALALFHSGLGIDQLILANPWVIETSAGDAEAGAMPAPAAVRARYWARLKNPRSLIDLFTGKISLRKLIAGLGRAMQYQAPTGLAVRMARALQMSDTSLCVLIAKRDLTAMAFMEAWNSAEYSRVQSRDDVRIAAYDTASHSFADDDARRWLYDHISLVMQIAATNRA
jgi:exosortase A-associated hydrolase 1